MFLFTCHKHPPSSHTQQLILGIPAHLSRICVQPNVIAYLIRHQMEGFAIHSSPLCLLYHTFFHLSQAPAFPTQVFPSQSNMGPIEQRCMPHSLSREIARLYMLYYASFHLLQAPAFFAHAASAFLVHHVSVYVIASKAIYNDTY